MRTLLCLLLAGGGLALAQGRGNPWDRMKHYDTNKDGKISKEEFTGPERFFRRFDSDGDGFVTKAEVEQRMAVGGRGGGGARGSRGADQLAKRIDTDKDGKVSKQEWEAFFDRADENEDGILQPEELRAALSGRKFHDNAPKVGDPAPAAKAAHAKDGRIVDLAKPRRTTVLVFGSWT